jgi:hypothetical protein
MNVTTDLSSTSIAANTSVTISGHLSLTNGTNVSNTVVYIYQNGTLLSSELSTNATGEYTYTWTAPSNTGTYPIKVNSTFGNYAGENTVNLAVILAPNITTIYPNSTGGESYEDLTTINVSIVEPNNQTFNITFTNNSAITIEWFIDGNEQTSYENLTQFNWSGNYTQEGTYLILVNVSNQLVGADWKYWNLTVNNTGIPTPEINSTDGTNKTLQNLNCFDTLEDIDNSTMNLTVIWYNNSIEYLSIDFNNSYSNGTFFTTNLNLQNTTKGENWTCSMKFFNGISFTSQVNTNNLTILNSPPIVTLLSPADGNTTTNKTPTFTWSATDDDNDTMTYEFNLTCYTGCAAQDSRYIQNISSTSYTIASNLKFLSDNNYYYNWSVIANDLEEYGTWTTDRNISIQSLVEISLLNSSIAFGTIAFNTSQDTTDNSPLPLLIENIGNVLVNITIWATDLWNSVSNPSQYYQFKVDNYTLENNSFNWGLSITSFANMSANGTGLLAISELNYTDLTDTAEVDINITGPVTETAGVRNSTITLTASLGE